MALGNGVKKSARYSSPLSSSIRPEHHFVALAV
jgi:hypothetical protein